LAKGTLKIADKCGVATAILHHSRKEIRLDIFIEKRKVKSMKNILFLLIVPSFMFLGVAAFSFFDSSILRSNHIVIHNGDRYQKCEAFVGRVLDGKQQGTTDQFVLALKEQQWAINAEGNVSDSDADDLQFVGYIAIFSMLVQIGAIHHIWRKLKSHDAQKN
jgi:hypothetical protein